MKHLELLIITMFLLALSFLAISVLLDTLINGSRML